MRSPRSEKTLGLPQLTARDNWPRYAAGMATEVLFVLGLAGIGLALATVLR